jgi:hypothetical protein
LISLKTAKEKLAICLEKLGFSLEKFGNPWSGLERLGGFAGSAASAGMSRA